MKNADKPAHPASLADHVGRDTIGLTKREMFAMAAMQGMLSNSDLMNHENGFPPVRSVIDYADELLKALDS